MPGIDIKRFVDLNERHSGSLICSICLNIFDNAVNSECRHSFCRQCVQQWIDTNHNKCPNCKKGFTPRKRRNNETDLILIGGYIFRHDFTANGIISDLKIKCSFDYNGCEEEIQFGSLSAHLKVCDHRICKTCEFPALPVDTHNCLELMRNQIKELKSKNQKSEQTVEGLTKEWENDRKEKTDLEKKLKSTKVRVEGLTQNLEKERKEETDLSLELQTTKQIVKQLNDRILKFEKVNENNGKVIQHLKGEHIVRCSDFRDDFTDFEETTEGIRIYNFKVIDEKNKYFKLNINIPFLDMEEMGISSKPSSFSYLRIKLNTISCKEIQKLLEFGLKAQKDQKHRFISFFITTDDSNSLQTLIRNCKTINPNIICIEG